MLLLRWPAVCRPVAVALLFAAATTCAARTMRTVAITGQAADSGGGEPLSFSQFGTATINGYGEVALLARSQQADLTTADGIWSEGGGQELRLVALDGRPAPGVDGGTFANMIANYPIINDAGQVLFRARLADAPGITGTNNSGVWIADAGQSPDLVLREGAMAPGASTGAVFAEQADVFGQRYSAFNDQGQVAWLTELLIGTGGVTGNNDFGVWRAGGGGPVLAVGVEGSVAAGVSPTRYYGNISATAQMNDLGQVTFLAPLKNTPGSSANSGSGIWLGDPAVGMTLLARDGQTAPETNGATFAAFTRPTLNDQSEYAFAGSLNFAGDVSSTNDQAVWVAREGNPLALLVRESDHAPGTNPAVGFGAFDSLRINSAGRVAFQAQLTGIPDAGDSGVTVLNDTGIWSEGDGGGLQLVAREDDQAPGVPEGVLFDLFRSHALNSAGQVAFMADLRGSGVSASNNTGLWAQTTDGSLSLIAREGDEIDVDYGPGVDLRTIVQLAFFADSGGEDGQRTGLNPSGDIAFTAVFSDNTSGVFVVNLADTLPGDYNQDHVVDAADYTVWRDQLGSATALFNDDTPGVGADDYVRWKMHFGESGGGASSMLTASAASIAVPEPAPLALAVLAIVLLGIDCVRGKAV
jgi:hypothetical protein